MRKLCEICGKQFSKSNLYCHLRSVHKTEPNLKKHLKCSECNSLHKSYELLRNHYVITHNYEIYIEIKQFNTKEEFITWKENKEKELKCSYVKQTGTKSQETKLRSYYICHRSAQIYDDAVIKGATKKQKSQGSSKSAHTCPSTLDLIQKNGNFLATLYTPHIGHICTLTYLNLTKTERSHIAEKLEKGASFEKILNDVQANISSETSLERIHLLNRQDLRNIKKEFSLDVNIEIDKNDQNKVCGNNNEKIRCKLNILYSMLSQDFDEETILKLEKSLDKTINIASEGKIRQIKST